MSKTQFDKQVKVTRFDNAKEFDDQYCRPYYAELGIIYLDILCQHSTAIRGSRGEA